MLSLVAAAIFIQPVDAKILFLGNSHTSSHDVPAMVASLLRSDKKHRQVATSFIFGGHLRSLYNQPGVLNSIRTGGFSHVVLQAQEISMSHKYDYSKKEGIMLAQEAKRAGARAIYFAEWPRRGIVETNYIYNIYAGMAKLSGATVAPTGHVWEMALARDPKLPLWAGDGNHSAPMGAYLAALTIYFVIAGPNAKPTWRPTGIDAGTQKWFETLAKKPKVM